MYIVYKATLIALSGASSLRPRWKEIYAALATATTTVHCGSGSHSALSRCWPMLSYCSRALSLSLLRTATALVPAALLFSKRHWGFGIEPTLRLSSRSHSCSHALLFGTARALALVLCVRLRVCAFVCSFVCYAAFYAFPFISLSNCFWQLLLRCRCYCCCCCCHGLLLLFSRARKKVSQMSCLGPRWPTGPPRGPHRLTLLWFDSSLFWVCTHC